MTDLNTGPSRAAWSYRPGPWFAVFGPEVTVLLPQSERGRVIDLWALVDGGGGFDEVLDGLLASGLSKLPGFVLVGASDGPTRVLLRGTGVTATLTSGGEDVTLEGGAGATWVERSLDDVSALRIEVPADGPEDTGDTEGAGGEEDFPVATGLVRVGRVDRPAVLAPPAAVAAPPGDLADAGVLPEQEAASVAGVSDHSLIADDGAAPVIVPGPGDGPERLEELSADTAGSADPAGEGAPFEAPATEPDAEPDAEADDAEAPVSADEASPFDEPAAEDETDAADLPTDVMPAVDGDPLTDPLPGEEADTLAPAGGDGPAEPAPDGWVTPYDGPATDESPEPAPVGEAGEEPDTLAPPVAADLPDAPAPDAAPPSWTPPPPPEAPPADAPPPPLGIGSWEPVTGAQPAATDYPPPPPPPADPDHDGLTVAGGPSAPPQPGQPSQPAPPPVTAPVAKLHISDGQTITVDRVVLIGRAPEARRFSATEQPLLVTVPSRLHEISSTHVEVRPGGGADLGTAVVTDMGSTNGTVLVQPGLGPEDLKPGIAVQLIPGAIINLGDGITIQVTRP